jgi:hypothetical protein
MADSRYEAVLAAMVAADKEGSESGLLTGHELRAHIFLAAFDAASGNVPQPEAAPPAVGQTVAGEPAVVDSAQPMESS